MPVSNGIVTAPISIEDVKQCLGVSNNDLGYLCSNEHGKTNMWAKYKPVIHSALFADDEQRSKAQNGDYGLAIQNTDTGEVLTGTLELIEAKNTTSYNWIYKPPYGGDLAPFRLTDFELYNHSSRIFLRSNRSASTDTVNTFSLGTNSRYTVYFTLNTEEATSQPNELTLDDINEANVSGALKPKDCYMGCMLVRRTTGAYNFFFHETKISESLAIEISFPIDGYLSNGNYDIYFFLANGYQTSGSTGLAERIIPLPWDSNNLISWGITVTPSIPATCGILGITAVPELSSQDNLSSKSYNNVSYYSAENYPVNTLHTDYGKNVCFWLRILSPTAGFYIFGNEWTLQAGGNSYQLNVQYPGETSASASGNVSGTDRRITVVAGQAAVILYAICTQEIAAIYQDGSNEPSLNIYARDALFAGTGPLSIDRGGASNNKPQ